MQNDGFHPQVFLLFMDGILFQMIEIGTGPLVQPTKISVGRLHIWSAVAVISAFQ